MTIYHKNLHHTRKFWKLAYNKAVKPRSYVSGNKVGFFKTKQNRKLEAKFFRPFQVLHLIDIQAYKLKLFKM